MTKVKDEIITESQGDIDVQVLNIPGQIDDLQDDPEQTPGLIAPEEVPGAISPEMAKMVLQTPFAVAAHFLGDYWELSKGEVDLMTPSATVVFNKLFGKYMEDYPEAYMLGVSLTLCIGSRVGTMLAEKNKINEPTSPITAEEVQ